MDINSWTVRSRVWETWRCSYRAVRSNSSQVMLKAREEWGHPGRSCRIRERGDRLLGRFTVIWGELKMWKGVKAEVHIWIRMLASREP